MFCDCIDVELVPVQPDWWKGEPMDNVLSGLWDSKC